MQFNLTCTIKARDNYEYFNSVEKSSSITYKPITNVLLKILFTQRALKIHS